MTKKLELWAEVSGKVEKVIVPGDYGKRVDIPKDKRRCSCHSSTLYDSLKQCPNCRHWSFDPIAESCERRKCGYAA